MEIGYSKSLLKKINSLEVNNIPMPIFFSKSFNLERHSFWAFQQYYILNDIKKFSETKDTSFSESFLSIGLLNIIKSFVLKSLGFFVSLFFLLKIRFRKINILIYGSDKLKKGTNLEPRLFRAHSYLIENNIYYGEIIHTLFGKEFFVNLLKRKRSALYFEAFDFFYFVFSLKKRERNKKLLKLLESVSLDEFNQEERLFVRFILKKYFKSCLLSEFRISLFKKIFKRSHVKKILTIDDVRYSNEFVIAARSLGIKIYMFQHSNFDYFYNTDTLGPSLYVFPDTFYVWNDYWKKRLPEISPLFSFYKDRIKIGGRCSDYKIGEFDESKNSNDFVNVLIPYEVNVDKDKISKYIKCIMACKKNNIFFTVRPDIEKEKQLDGYKLGEFVRSGLIKIFELKDIKNVDVVVGVYSTYLDEMIERGKPVGILNIDYPVFNNLVDEGLASCINLDNNTCNKILDLKNTSIDVLKKRRSVFADNFGDINDTLTDIFGDY